MHVIYFFTEFITPEGSQLSNPKPLKILLLRETLTAITYQPLLVQLSAIFTGINKILPEWQFIFCFEE